MHPLLTTLEWHGIARPIGSYGALLALALVTGGVLALRSAARVDADTGALIAALAGAVAMGFVGAYTLSLGVLWLQLGALSAALGSPPGIVFYGGFVAGAAGLLGFSRVFGLAPLPTLDLMLPAVPIGHAIGRLGCLLGGCCYGAPSGLPWAVHYGPEHLARHPWPLYEAAGLCVLAAVFAAPQRCARFAGQRSASYVLGYALLRFALEPLRGDSDRGLLWHGSLSTGQLCSLLLGFGAALFLYARARPVPAQPLFLAIVTSGLSWAAWALADAGEPPQWEVLSVAPSSPARVHISGGWFVLGSDEAELARARALCASAAHSGGCEARALAAEQPARRVFVRAFDIDRLEVSNAEHQRCVSAGRCYPPRTEPAWPRRELPVVQLTWREARDYCRFVGGDLPSEAQWEYAAHGSSQRSFPWGPVFAPGLGAFAGQGAQPVAANPAGKSFFGLLNMAGNVWELVLDRYRGPYDSELPSVDPLDIRGAGERVLRGGSWRSGPVQVRARSRAAIPEDEPREDVGLRCAYPVVPRAP